MRTRIHQLQAFTPALTSPSSSRLQATAQIVKRTLLGIFQEPAAWRPRCGRQSFSVRALSRTVRRASLHARFRVDCIAIRPENPRRRTTFLRRARSLPTRELGGDSAGRSHLLTLRNVMFAAGRQMQKL